MPLTEKMYRPVGRRRKARRLTPKLRELMEAHEGDELNETVGEVIKTPKLRL